MSEKNLKTIRKNSRRLDKADVRWIERDRTLQRRKARFIKSITRNI